MPFLRPNFVTQKQYDNLVRTGERLSRGDRAALALGIPSITFPHAAIRLKNAAAIDPLRDGRVSLSSTCRFRTAPCTSCSINADALSGAAYAEGLSTCSTTALL